ncbi:uncharacterized protein UMAG_01443 [Mycosarcoma maydis]|uniref:Uncharacterized protein n=1 Tax=Mycosarcoma maydis TaxID=5270 RepID=A0A0D1CA95_MYCMD|nr:uncharacterized protein UMAG_01443 [Ustilago maydis 521]KIS70267.1 hypothetical protein UMAG_01443 [Ustilago maydis 521]|eukprot:XP_011387518.1 hypothetical protein UMAG_01443 [Ustilago maydis 521]
MTEKHGKKRAHTGSARGETPPVGPQAVSAPPRVDCEQLSISNALLPAATDSSRTKQAKDSVNKLKQLWRWDTLTSVHRDLCNLNDPDFTENAAQFADMIWASSTELSDIIPEFKSMTDKSRLEWEVSNVYWDLAAKIASYSDVDEALSLALVHVAHSLPIPTLGPQGSGANARFSAEFWPYLSRYCARPLPSVCYRTQSDAFNELEPEKGDIYFRGTTIFQSSGTGKSRMVYECRHQTPLLYVCIGPTSDEGPAKEAYPLPDRGVRAFFENAQKTHKDKCNLHIACFLGAWFAVLAHHLAKLPTQQQKHDYLMQLNHLDQNAGQNPQRTDFFQTVFERASLSLKLSDRSLKDWYDFDRIFTAHIRSPLDALEREMKCIIAHMHPPNNRGGSSPTHPVMVAFDDCVELNVRSDQSTNQLDSLHRAWNWISIEQARARTTPFWLVLISTSISAAYFVNHAPPFLAPWELLRTLTSSTTDDRCGRSSGLKTSGRMAKLKLTGGEKFAIRKPAHCLGVLASRLALRLLPTQSSDYKLFELQKQFVDCTVDRHMRIVTHVSSEGVMHVESPSEPVLAIAASNIMLAPYLQEPQKARGYTYSDILFGGHGLLEPGNLEVPSLMGSLGELASRIILMAACDAVKRKRIEQTEPKETSHFKHVPASIFAKPVPLESVLENLADLDEANLAALRQRLEDVYDAGSRTERNAIPIRDQSQSASATLPMWINFTHFDVLPKAINEITPEFLWYCWKRGVAVQMVHAQYGIDGIIPVFVGSSTDASNASLEPREAEMHAARYMTYVAWEAKNQRDPQSTTVPARSAPAIAGPVIKSALMAPPNEKPLTEQALLSVLLDLGTRTGFKQAPDGLRPQVIPLTGQQCPRLCIRGMLDSHAYPCLDLFEFRRFLMRILLSRYDPVPDSLTNMEKALWNERIQPDSDSI